MQTQQTKECIDLCNSCRDDCEETLFNYCFEIGGKHVDQKHVRLMADCIEMCQTAAHLMLRGSEMHAAICEACAKVCEACEESCEDIGGDEMKNCADICRRCAESCRKMSGMIGSIKQSGQSEGRVM